MSEKAKPIFNRRIFWDVNFDTSLILFFAFQGGDVGLNVGGEIKDPKRTVPRAIFIGIGFVLVLYILIQTVSQGVLGSALAGFKEATLAQVGKVVFGPNGFTLILIGTGISMFGTLSGQILNNPHVLFALANDKVLSVKALAAIHPKNKISNISIVVYAGIGFILASIGGFKQLAVIASASMLLMYLGVALSVIKLRRINPDDKAAFKIPGGATVPLLAAITILFFLFNLMNFEKVGLLIFIGVLTFVYAGIKWFEKRKKKPYSL